MIKQFRVELGQSRTSLEKQKVKNKKEGWRQNRGNGLKYHVYKGGIQMSGEKNKLQHERYVNDDLLGKEYLFRSARGQIMGLFNTKIANWVDFGEIGLTLETAPKKRETVREILYKDIVNVDVKTYINMYYMIFLVVFVIGAAFTGGASLIGAALIYWAGSGKRVKIQLSNGTVISLISVQIGAKAYTQEFVSNLQMTVQRAKNGNSVEPSRIEADDVVSRLFITRNLALSGKSQESWEYMKTYLEQNMDSAQLAQQLCEMTPSDNKMGLATEDVNPDIFKQAVGKVIGYLEKNEKPLLFIDQGLVSKLKKFTVITDKRVLFVKDVNVRNIAYDRVYKISNFMSLGWTLNGFVRSCQEDEYFAGAILGAEQLGTLLALICRSAVEQRGEGYRIVANNVAS